MVLCCLFTRGYMNRIGCILILLFMMSSCATILNKPFTYVKVYTTEPSEVIYKKDTFETSNNTINLISERKNEILSFTVFTDSISKTVEIEPKNSFFYWFNIYANYGIGMLIDRSNSKRYTYPHRIYINSSDTISRYYRHSKSNNTSEFHLHLSLPHINSFRMAPENESTKINTGFWGLAIGLDYYHSKDQFLSTSISAVSDLFVPVPAPFTISGEFELMSSKFINLSNNHRYRRFTFGYGFSYARNTWDLKFYDLFDPPPPTREPVKRSHNTFGLVFPTYYQLGEYFNIGIIYRPTIYRPNMPDKFAYEHLISVDFAWKIKLK